MTVKIKHGLKVMAPWIAAFIILGIEFYNIDLYFFFESLKSANLLLYIPLVVLFVLIWFVIESFNLQKLYQYFGYSLRYKKMLNIRGATFLLMIVNYGLGAGGIAMYMKRDQGVPLLRSTSILFYYMVVESAGIAFLAVTGFLLAGDSSKIQYWVIYLSLYLFGFYVLEIVLLKYIPPVGFLKRFINSRLVEPIRESTWPMFFSIFFQRMVYFITFIIFFYYATRAFHMQIPLLTLTALVPIIFFVGNIPITPFGLGTIQAGMLYFFRDYGTEANILAMSIVYTVSLMFFRALIGLFYLHKVNGLKLEIVARTPENISVGMECN